MLPVLGAISALTQKIPNKVSVSYGEQTLTYSEFWGFANRVASALKSEGVNEGDFVAIICERSEFLPSYLVGVLLAGAAYVPIDPQYPLERQFYVLNDCKPKIAICSEESASFLAGHGVMCLTHDNIESASSTFSPAQEINHESLAYLIYTSGSTGDPKGVEISRANMTNFLASMATTPGMAIDDTLLSVTTISFDIHVLEIFLPLLCGGHLVIASGTEAKDGKALFDLIDKHKVSLLQATPVTWKLLRTVNESRKIPLKALVGGEALDKHLAGWMCGTFSEVWNMYGPTETTVWSTCTKVIDSESDISIGTAIANTDIAIVNEDLSPLQQGETGELLIGGLGVAKGYHKKPDLTAERFVQFQQDESGPECFYRTGDLAKMDDDGKLYCMGRLDFQVKINGFRIELGEIEFQLEKIPLIKQAVASVEGGDQLIAFISVEGEIDHPEIRNQLRHFLPSHMVPREIIEIDNFPLTPNNKLDRKALVQNISQYRGSIEPATKLPENELVKAMLILWRAVLDNKSIDVDDRYFDIGGDSLRMFTLSSEINTSLGIDVPASTFISNPSVRDVCDSLNENTSEGGAHIVPLQLGGDQAPIYGCCGVSLYQDLANEYVSDRNFFGVYAHQEIQLLADIYAAQVTSLSIEDLGEKYAQAILRHAGEGKTISLLGFSFGGLLAHYVAARLEKLGLRIQQLILIDTVLPIGARKSKRRRFINKLRTIFSLGLVKNKTAEEDVRDERVEFVLNNTNLDKSEIQVDAETARSVRDHIYDEATAIYIDNPAKYDGNVILIKANNNELLKTCMLKEDYGWSAILKREIDTIISVSGGHRSLLAPSSTHALYSALKEHLAGEV